jgi:hypothetical protein
MKTQVQSLKEMYGKPTCWEKSSAPLVRFSTGDSSCWGFPFFAVVGTEYVPEQERLLIYFPVLTVNVQGPKAGEFYDDFCNSRATNLKADEKGIVSVEIDLNRDSQR